MSDFELSQSGLRFVEAVSLLERLVPSDSWDHETSADYQELWAHIQTICDALEPVDPERTARLLADCAMNMHYAGEFDDALPLQQRALTIEEATYGPGHPQVATTLGNLGIIQQELGRLDEAETTQQRALTIFEATYGPGHPQVATTLVNLGIIQQKLGRLDEAETTQQRALTIKEAMYRPNHPEETNALAKTRPRLSDG